MKRLVVLAASALALAAPAAAVAHPLGNFTINRHSRIEISGDHLYVVYVLDLAEIPTFQARQTGIDAKVYARRIAAGTTLTVGGRLERLRPVKHVLAFPKGAAGLQTTRLEVLLAGPKLRGMSDVVYHDNNYASRIGWSEVIARANDGAHLRRTTVPATSRSDELRAYPKDLLQSPLRVTSATIRVEAGSAGPVPTLSSGATLQAPDRVADSGFARLVARDRLSAGVVALSLLLALFWGAAHAFSPGHGKSIVAAYLVGSRGTPRHAVFLGLIVTVTHTIGVFALGFVTLALSQFVVPADLYPWLNLVSALLVVVVGLAVLRARLRSWFHARAHTRGHAHDHHHAHGHSHVPPAASGLRSLVGVGISGGILPCPTALVVLLAAISLHRVGYGLVLIVAFSLGLAASVTGIGLVAVSAKSFFARTGFDGRLIRALPAVSALVVLGLGLAMTLRALPSLI
jgi:nickel/cobalt exporter